MTFLAGVDVAGYLFIVLIGGALLYIVRLDQQPGNFRAYQFIADAEGYGSSASLAYTGVFLVGVWLTWYLAMNRQWTEAVGLFGGLAAIYVTGGVARANISAKERTAALNASAEPPGAPAREGPP